MRKQIVVRLDVPDLATIRDLAARETEGNVSQMVRRLIDEALRARAAKEDNDAWKDRSE